MVITIRDITERRLMEKERQQNELLEEKITIAEESLKFKQNFLANMSHEIRTPLTGVLGMIDILEQTPLSVNQKDYLETIKTSGENLREIINQVLDYSKIEAGKIAVNPVAFPFRSLAQNAVELYKNSVKPGVEIHSDTDPDIPEFIEADKSRLAQVLNNFVSNAIKFTHQGSITIKSSIVARDNQNHFFTIKMEVSDTGIGIPDQLQEKLFIPFSQVEAMDTRNYEGTGLGLSICKQLIELMGGEIGVHSIEEKGSTFWFSFSAKIPDSQPTITTYEPTKHSNKQLSILLAEDKIVNQKVISLMLNAMGHRVTIANDGQEAIDIFEPGKFDLILMDIQMPIMDGITATQKLKGGNHQELPPIVGLSANAFEGDREKYMTLGMDEYLTKPVKKEEFEGLIEKLDNK
jgi:two-component system, sensor histidine kinase